MGVGVAGVANYVNTSSGTASDVVAYGGVGGPYEYCSFFSVLNWFAKGEPGAWYDPSDFQPNWRRNLLTYSEDFSNAAWVKTDATIAPLKYTAPSGLQTANKLVEGTLNGAHFTYLNTTFPTGTSCTYSIYAKAGERRYISIYCVATAAVQNSFFDLVNGTVVSISTGATGSITSVGEGWYRCTVTTVTASTSTGIYPGISTDGITSSYLGDGTSGIYIWGAQLEQSSSASTYQKITDGIQDYYTVQPQPVLFQDSAGTTPVTAVEQPVGLMLDKSRGLALGAELVTNGDFSNGTTGWTTVGTVISSGVVTFSGAGVKQVYQNGVMSASKHYKITFTITRYVSGNVYIRCGTIESLPITIASTGTYSIISNSDGALLTFLNYASSDFDIDNISVKQIAGNHAFQATAGNRPVLSARVNILTKTEDFSDASWIKGTGANVATTSVVAPNGTLTVSKYYLSNLSTDGPSVQLSKGPFTATANLTLSCYVKSAGATGFFVIQDGAGNGSMLNLSTWQISSNMSNGIGTVIPLADGWYKFIITTTSTNPYFYSYFSSFTGDGVSGIYLWGADLRPTNSGALLPPYQRVNTASDYDTVGFPLYLKANGTSSAMSTNSIDFTATDKMTVVTGVRKLSDAANANVFEMGNTLPAGGFNLYAPNTVSSPSYSSYANAGTVSLINSSSSYPAPIANVISMLLNTSAASPNQHLLRVNSIGSGTQSATLSGNFTNIPLYLFSRAGTSSFLNGNFYGAIIRGAQSDTASVTQTENYMAQKTGITF